MTARKKKSTDGVPPAHVASDGTPNDQPVGDQPASETEPAFDQATPNGEQTGVDPALSDPRVAALQPAAGAVDGNKAPVVERDPLGTDPPVDETKPDPVVPPAAVVNHSDPQSPVAVPVSVSDPEPTPAVTVSTTDPTAPPLDSNVLEAQPDSPPSQSGDVYAQHLAQNVASATPQLDSLDQPLPARDVADVDPRYDVRTEDQLKGLEAASATLLEAVRGLAVAGLTRGRIADTCTLAIEQLYVERRDAIVNGNADPYPTY